MATKEKLQFAPDYAVPPGETILETLEELGMTQSELADRMGRPKKTINEIIHAKAAITPETALQLERALGVPARVWNNLERDYREALARIAEQEELTRGLTLLKRIPLKDLIARGYVTELKDKVEQVRQLLKFFAVGTVKGWETTYAEPQASFRAARTFERDPGAVAAWMRAGELEAANLSLGAYDPVRFKATLAETRGLTRKPFVVALKEAQQRCAEAGVAFVVVPEFEKARLCGLARWAHGKPLIQLSLRYGTDDHFWFTFFHEAAHILLHRKTEVFIEGKGDDGTVDVQEEEANKFAEKALLSPASYEAFVKAGEFTPNAIEQFAREQGIAPSIVVGRLQRQGHISYQACPGMKQPIKDMVLT
ncbi:MAG TPA: HigA family addiction module antitoxin [Oscillatoriaceae cyanobacterium]